MVFCSAMSWTCRIRLHLFNETPVWWNQGLPSGKSMLLWWMPEKMRCTKKRSRYLEHEHITSNSPCIFLNCCFLHGCRTFAKLALHAFRCGLGGKSRLKFRRVGKRAKCNKNVMVGENRIEGNISPLSGFLFSSYFFCARSSTHGPLSFSIFGKV